MYNIKVEFIEVDLSSALRHAGGGHVHHHLGHAQFQLSSAALDVYLYVPWFTELDDHQFRIALW